MVQAAHDRRHAVDVPDHTIPKHVACSRLCFFRSKMSAHPVEDDEWALYLYIIVYLRMDNSIFAFVRFRQFIPSWDLTNFVVLNVNII